MARLADVVVEHVRERVEMRGEDWLAASFAVVNLLSERQAARLCDELVGRWLTRIDADILQLAAQRLGRQLEWRRAALQPDAEFEAGRLVG